ncbi:MAG: hypothetical protein ABI648_14820 [Betaproteobacteria bacterium]
MKRGRMGGQRAWLPAACLLLAVPDALAVEAGEVAFIMNRAFAVGEGKEVDAAVRVLRIDSVPVSASLSKVPCSAGRHVIEVSCTARVFAGMGTVDFDSRSAMAVEVAAGRTYQLGARYSVRGDCAPVLE